MIKEIILILLFVVVGVYISIITYPEKRTVIINCGISEISPDYTNAMKETCRKERVIK